MTNRKSLILFVFMSVHVYVGLQSPLLYLQPVVTGVFVLIIVVPPDNDSFSKACVKRHIH